MKSIVEWGLEGLSREEVERAVKAKKGKIVINSQHEHQPGVPFN